MTGKDKNFIKQTPGPGQYNPDGIGVKKKAARYSMGT